MLCFYFSLFRKSRMSCCRYLQTNCLRRSTLGAMRCLEMTRFVLLFHILLFKYFAALVFVSLPLIEVSQLLYLSKKKKFLSSCVSCCFRWMIYQGCTGSFLKYHAVWSLCLIYLSRFVTLNFSGPFSFNWIKGSHLCCIFSSLFFFP